MATPKKTTFADVKEAETVAIRRDLEYLRDKHREMVRDMDYVDYWHLRDFNAVLADKRNWQLIDLWRDVTSHQELLEERDGKVWQDGYIAGGGAVRYLLRHTSTPYKKPFDLDGDAWSGDIDVFATSEEAFGRMSERLRGLGYFLYKSNDLVHEYWHENWLTNGYTDVQLLRPHPAWAKHAQPVKKMLQQFDLSCSRAVVVHPFLILADGDAVNRDMVIRMVNNPIKTISRALKYHRRGYAAPHAKWLVHTLETWRKMSDERREAIIEARK
jgi:hypothetical protein